MADKIAEKKARKRQRREEVTLDKGEGPSTLPTQNPVGDSSSLLQL